MLYANFAAYKKEFAGEEFQGSICENNFFGVLSTEGGLEKEKGEALLRKLASDIAEQKIEHLVDLDAYVTDFCKNENLPASFSFSCGYLTGEVFLLKTIGDGVVYVKRKHIFSNLLEKNLSASGYVENEDSFIFTTDSGSAGYKEALKKIIDKADPAEAAQALVPEIAQKDLKDRVALFVRFENKEPTLTEAEEHLVADPSASTIASQQISEHPNIFKEWLGKAKAELQGQDKKKKTTLILISIILVVFIWSVVLGYQRRTSATLDQRTQETKELVVENLRQAEDVAFLNLARATALITEAKGDVAALKKELKGKKPNEIADLEKLVAEKEESVLKKEERSFEEYYDLSVEDRNAVGSRLYFDGENTVILDTQSGTAYLLSLSKKSLEKRNASEFRNGDLVVRSDDNIFVLKKGAGIFGIDTENKAKKVVENDKDWGDISAMVTYNKNLYLLDRTKGDVYKYVPAEQGFSEKSSYFKGQDNPNISGANSLAIDLSVHVGFPDAIAKFTSGQKEGFNPTFPEDDTNIIKIITNTDIEKIYAWDKKKSTLYVVNKSGVYERQVNSPIFGKGDDIEVFGANAYILKGSKIYRVSVD